MSSSKKSTNSPKPNARPAAQPSKNKKVELPFYFNLPGLKPIGQFIYSLDFEVVTPGFFRFGLASFLIGLIMTVTVGLSYGYAYTRNVHFPTPSPAEGGKLVDVFGGFNFFIKCSEGKSPYTVVLDAGLGSDSTEYAAVLEQLGKEMRVCVYDRAGFGYSQLSHQPSAHLSTTGSRVASVFAKDLKYLLKVAKVPGPYVLVGHGPSAIAAQYFAEKYGQVSGLVLINPLDKHAMEAHNFEWKAHFESSWRSNFFWKWCLAVAGLQAVVQDYTSLGSLPPHYAALSPERQALARHLAGRSDYWRALMEESGMMSLSATELHDLRRAGAPNAKSAAALPVQVLLSESFSASSSPSMHAAMAASANAVSKAYPSAQVVKVSGDDSFTRSSAEKVIASIKAVVPSN